MDGNLTEKNEAVGERGREEGEDGAGGCGKRGNCRPALARSHGSAAGSPTPKVFSHWIHFITGSPEVLSPCLWDLLKATTEAE